MTVDFVVCPAYPQEHARVDFESARNAAAYAYLPAEALLAKLESLTGTAAAAQGLQQYQEMYRWGGTCMQYMHAVHAGQAVRVARMCVQCGWAAGLATVET
jgi:NADH pyrophosphatase NudC (nudix superfamily)